MNHVNTYDYSKILTLLIILSLIVSSYIAFGRILRHEFINLDDNVYVTENPYVKEGMTREGLIWAFSRTHGSGMWIPLTWISLMLDAQIYGLNTGGYYLSNLMLHILNGILLFLLLKMMTGAVWQSAFVAALFALHPLRVETVAWITERKDVLSTLFFMLTMWTYVLYTKRPNLKRYFLIWIPFILGLMAKPMLVTLPFLLLLLDYWPLRRLKTADWTDKKQRKSHRIIHLVMEKVPLFLMAIIICIITLFTVREFVTVQPFPLSVRISNALVSYVRYLGKMFWPSKLAIFYPHPGMIPVWQVAGATLILSFLSLFIVWKAHHPYLLMGWLWYLGTLLPVMGIIQVGSQAMADRFTYIPLIGLFMIMAWGVPDLLKKWHYRKTLMAVSGCILILLMISCTRSQARYWQNSTTVFKHALKVTDNNWLIHYNLGLELIRNGKINEGIAHYVKALSIRPECERAHNNLGAVLAQQGRIDDAIFHYHEALKIKPDYANAHLNLGMLMAARGNFKEALNHYHEALKARPDFSKVHFHRGLAYLQMGNKMAAQNTYETLKTMHSDFAAILLERIMENDLKD